MGSGLPLLGRLALLLAGVAPLAACNYQLTGDPVADAGAPSALGSGYRIRDVMNPSSPDRPASGKSVYITGATFLLVDAFDETHDGKSIGTVYLQDVPPSNVPPPYSGASLYDQTYVPTSLLPAPGDVLDLTGTFSVSASLGSATFDPGTSLIQISKPVVKPRFEYVLPPPLVLPASALDEPTAAAYASANQWTSMLVTIENVTFPDGLADDGKGRDTIHLMSDTSSNGPTLSNELFDLASWNNGFSADAGGPPLAQGKTVKSVTGIVTWFFNFHLAPRSPADIVVQ
jgi:hypothetical protein